MRDVGIPDSHSQQADDREGKTVEPLVFLTRRELRLKALANEAAPAKVYSGIEVAHTGDSRARPWGPESRAEARRRQRDELKRSKRSGTRIAQHAAVTVAAAGVVLASVAPLMSQGVSASDVSELDQSLAQTPRAVSAGTNTPKPYDAPMVAAQQADPDEKLHKAVSASGDVAAAQSVGKGTLSAPVKGDVVMSSSFGNRINPVTGAGGEFHTGQDFAVQCGREVYAAAGGKVIFAGWHQFGGGNRVEIDHGNGMVTTYNHNSAIKVTVGQQVSRGELLALAGTTGNSTGCHVHFEVLLNSKPVNPIAWL